MGERILVPYDGSPLSKRAIERAVTMHHDSEITIPHVTDPVRVVYEAESKGLPEAKRWHDRMSERANEQCADAEAQAAEHDRCVTTAIETETVPRVWKTTQKAIDAITRGVPLATKDTPTQVGVIRRRITPSPGDLVSQRTGSDSFRGTSTSVPG